MFFFGCIILIFAIILFILFPLPQGTSLSIILIATASCMARIGSVIIMIYVMRRVEVSRVVPVVYAYPIYVAIMAVPLLGESLQFTEWIAIVIVVAGAIMISIKRNTDGSGAWVGKPFLFLVGSSLLMALADISSKYVFSSISFLNMMWISCFCLPFYSAILALRRKTFSEIKNMQNKVSTLVLIFINETIATTGLLLLYWAIQKGPVSLVSTVSASRPIFVLVVAFILSRFSPSFLLWQRGKVTLILRIIATVMIVGGIIIIYLK